MQPSNPDKPPRNRDQETPKREGDDIPNTAVEERVRDRERNTPVPEEETYEREPRNQRVDRNDLEE
jgi:hypothetical protein